MSLRVEGTQSDVQRRQEQATALQASLATAQASSLHVLHVIVQEMHKYPPPLTFTSFMASDTLRSWMCGLKPTTRISTTVTARVLSHL